MDTVVMRSAPLIKSINLLIYWLKTDVFKVYWTCKAFCYFSFSWINNKLIHYYLSLYLSEIFRHSSLRLCKDVQNDEIHYYDVPDATDKITNLPLIVSFF